MCIILDFFSPSLRWFRFLGFVSKQDVYEINWLWAIEPRWVSCSALFDPIMACAEYQIGDQHHPKT